MGFVLWKLFRRLAIQREMGILTAINNVFADDGFYLSLSRFWLVVKSFRDKFDMLGVLRWNALEVVGCLLNRRVLSFINYSNRLFLFIQRFNMLVSWFSRSLLQRRELQLLLWGVLNLVIIKDSPFWLLSKVNLFIHRRICYFSGLWLDMRIFNYWWIFGLWLLLLLFYHYLILLISLYWRLQLLNSLIILWVENWLECS